jgi:predicted DNA-binding transcriptional regulator AlpA
MSRNLSAVSAPAAQPLARLADLLAECRSLEIPPDRLPEAAGQAAALQAEFLARLAAPPKPAGEDRLLEVEEAAKVLGIAPQTLYRKARSLPFTVRIGAAVRFSEAGIQKFIRLRQGV